jgi:hypothetical protein
VTLHDVVVGRDALYPRAPCCKPKSFAFNSTLSRWRCTGKRRPAAGAERRATRIAPTLLERDAGGRLNWQRFFKTSQQQPGARWTASSPHAMLALYIEMRRCVVPAAKRLLADARAVDGRVQFNGNDPMTFRVAAASTQIRSQCHSCAERQPQRRSRAGRQVGFVRH